MLEELDELSKITAEICKKNGWTKDWQRGGCYLHLEVSEFIEALRGKGDPIDEMSDVFFTLLSTGWCYGVKPSEAIARLVEKHGIEEGAYGN